MEPSIQDTLIGETKKEGIKISKKSLKIVSVVVVIIIVAAFFYWKYYEGQKNIVATIDDETITIDELNKVYASMPAQYQGLITKEALLDQLVQAKVLYLEAQKQGVTINDSELENKLIELKKSLGLTDEEFSKELAAQGKSEAEIIENYKKQLTIQKFLDEKVFASVTITEKDTKDYYKENLAQFNVDEQVTVRHILVGNATLSDDVLSAKARGILAKATQDNFCDLVQEYSIDSGSVPTCGEYTFGKDAALVEEFKNLSFKQKPGQMGIVKSMYGYHIIWTVKKTPAKTLTLEEGRGKIEETIKATKEKEVFKKYYDKLINDYTIKKSYNNKTV